MNNNIETDRTTIFLVRHGETAWNLQRRFQGQADIPLNATGVAQAQALALWLQSQSHPFTALYSSDLLRCVQTAEPIEKVMGLKATLSPELREIHCGEWEGYTSSAINAQFPGALDRWRRGVDKETIPGGESVKELVDRASCFYEQTIVNHLGESIIIVAHGGTISALMIAIEGLDIRAAWNDRDRRIDNTGVVALTLDHFSGDHNVLCFNSTEHLGEIEYS